MRLVRTIAMLFAGAGAFVGRLDVVTATRTADNHAPSYEFQVYAA